MTTDSADFFRQNGYLVIQKALSRTEVDQLNRAIDRDREQHPQMWMSGGEGGRFQQELAVYGRADESCVVCERPVQSVVLAGRSTFYCPSCQK